MRDELTEHQVAALRIVHARVHDLDASGRSTSRVVRPIALLRDHHRAGSPVWYFDHGSRRLIRSSHCNTVVVRWVAREWAVALAGPPASTLVDPIPVADLRREIIDVMHRFGNEILTDPTPYRNRFYQAFIVHTFSRMLHDLVEGRPARPVRMSNVVVGPPCRPNCLVDESPLVADGNLER